MTLEIKKERRKIRKGKEKRVAERKKERRMKKLIIRGGLRTITAMTRAVVHLIVKEMVIAIITLVPPMND